MLQYHTAHLYQICFWERPNRSLIFAEAEAEHISSYSLFNFFISLCCWANFFGFTNLFCLGFYICKCFLGFFILFKGVKDFVEGGKSNFIWAKLLKSVSNIYTPLFFPKFEGGQSQRMAPSLPIAITLWWLPFIIKLKHQSILGVGRVWTPKMAST